MKKDLVRFYQNYKIYIFSVVASLSSLILIIFVIYPQCIKLLKNEEVKKEINKKSEFLETKAQALEVYSSEDLSLKVNNVLSAYPVERDFPTVVGLLQSLTAESGFSIISLSVGAGLPKDTGSQSYSVTLDILGPVNSLSPLLQNIENSPRLMRISSIETAIAKDLGSATASLIVDILYSGAPKEFGGIESALPELSQKDEEVLAKLAQVSPGVADPFTLSELPPRGKANPFE